MRPGLKRLTWTARCRPSAPTTPAPTLSAVRFAVRGPGQASCIIRVFMDGTVTAQ